MLFLDPPLGLLCLMSTVQHLHAVLPQLRLEMASAGHSPTFVELLEAPPNGLVRRHVFPWETRLADLALDDAVLAALQVLLESVAGTLDLAAIIFATCRSILALAVRMTIQPRPRDHGRATRTVMRAVDAEFPQSFGQSLLCVFSRGIVTLRACRDCQRLAAIRTAHLLPNRFLQALGAEEVSTCTAGWLFDDFAAQEAHQVLLNFSLETIHV